MFSKLRVFLKTKLLLSILVPRARRFLVTWSGTTGRLQIKPSGSGDENVYCLERCACHMLANHDCWLKENEHDGIDDQNGFYLFYASCPFR